MPIQHRKYRKVVKLVLTICNKRLIMYRYVKYAFLLRKIKKASKQNLPTRFIAVRTNDALKKSSKYKVTIEHT